MAPVGVPARARRSTCHAGGERGVRPHRHRDVGALRGGPRRPRGRRRPRCFGSGMAAIAAALSLVPPGGRRGRPRHAYQVTLGYARDRASGRRRRCAGSTSPTPTRGRSAALRRAADLALGRVADQPDARGRRPAGAGRGRRTRRGALVGVDNTFATPLVQRPLDARRRRRRALGDQVPGRALRRRARRGVAPTTTAPATRGCTPTARCTARSPARSRCGSRCAACAPSRCGSSGRRPTPPSSPAGSPSTRASRGCGTRACPPTRATRAPRRRWTVRRDHRAAARGGAAAADAVVAACGCGCPRRASAASSRPSSGVAASATESLTVPEDLLRLSVGIEDVEDLWRDLRPGARPRLRPTSAGARAGRRPFGLVRPGQEQRPASCVDRQPRACTTATTAA